MYFLANVIGPILGVIYNVVGSYGVAIIILTVIMKLILLPLSIKQVKSTQAMSKIQPKVKELQKKYKDDKETLNRKTMELYSKEGVNPLMGCLPMLIQLPILFGLFGALRKPEVYVFAGQPELAAEVVNSSFLWVKSLAEPDLISNLIASGPDWLLKLPGILPIFSALTTYYSMQMNTQNSPQAGGGSMKAMSTVMPVMILVMGAQFASGLLVYWAVSNVFQMGQQYIIPKITEEA